MDNTQEYVGSELVRVGAFRSLDTPTLLTSGRVGVYYINTEKLLEDGGRFNEFGDDSARMMQHAIGVYTSNPHFKQVIDLLANYISDRISELPALISGGQRRDWLFSGPVAALLDLPHLSLYKPESNRAPEIVVNLDDETRTQVMHLPSSQSPYCPRALVYHVADLLTEGSSWWDENTLGGWVPMIRKLGYWINDGFTVVDRQEGGAHALFHDAGVTVAPLFKVTREFLQAHSVPEHRERNLAYINNPDAWGDAYVADNDLAWVLPFFDPANKKLSRAGAFLIRYEDTLKGEGYKWSELGDEVHQRFGLTLDQVIAQRKGE